MKDHSDVRKLNIMSPVEQQIAKLKPCVKSGVARLLHVYLVVGAVLLVVLSIVLWHPIPLMLAVFMGIVGLCSRESGALLVNAIQAYETANHDSCEVSISIDNNSDSDRYYAIVSRNEGSVWRYEFIPQGWKPLAGTYAGVVWGLPSDLSPKLTSINEGILIPRYKPKLLSSNPNEKD